MKRTQTAKLIALLLAALMLLALCACGSGGKGRPTTYDGENDFAALLDYANRLEEAGNEEAAALVRAKIPQAAAGEANEQIEQRMQNDENLQTVEAVKDAVEIAAAMKGDK